MTQPPRPLPGVVLAGGRASRMGGADKALLQLGGRTLAAHAAARLGAQVTHIALNANGDPARFAALGLPVLPDPVPDWPGPLAGVLAALDWAATLGADQVITVATDTPFLPPDLVARLTAAGPAAVAASADPSGKPRRHPTCALWPVQGRAALRTALDGGLRKLGLWAEQQGAQLVVWEPAPHDPFFNINTPDDLIRAESLLARLPA